MVRKESLDHGNDNYTMLIDLILNLTPTQVKMLYQELKARYTNRGHTKRYNALGELDKEHGRIRLTEYQFKTLRLKYGKTYMQKALNEMDEYIAWLELHQDIGKYRSKLCQLNSRTHAKEFDAGGWVYDKCKKYINQVNTDVCVSPFLIEDISVARKYIEALPLSMRKMPDVMWLVEKFPELQELVE